MRFLTRSEPQPAEIRRARPMFASSFSEGRDSPPDFCRHAGNQAIQSLFRSGAVQASLALGTVDDPAEREADAIADRVTSGFTPDRRSDFTIGVQRSPSSASSSDHVPGVVEQVLRSSGHPLDPSIRAAFESRFGRDFRHVRVHTGSEAAASARSINALAYTAGADIVFANGRYSPHTDDGKRLLAHELAHTVQQSERPSAIVRRTPDLGGLTVSVTHTGTTVPISGVNVHIDQKNVSSSKAIDLVTDSSGNTPFIQLEEGNYTITVTYKCCQQTLDAHVAGNVDQVSFFELGRCECGIASADQNGDGAAASADSSFLTQNDQGNA
jgi:Domain of unknown function (DUF4157)